MCMTHAVSASRIAVRFSLRFSARACKEPFQACMCGLGYAKPRGCKLRTRHGAESWLGRRRRGWQPGARRTLGSFDAHREALAGMSTTSPGELGMRARRVETCPARQQRSRSPSRSARCVWHASDPKPVDRELLARSQALRRSERARCVAGGLHNQVVGHVAHQVIDRGFGVRLRGPPSKPTRSQSYSRYVTSDGVCTSATTTPAPRACGVPLGR